VNAPAHPRRDAPLIAILLTSLVLSLSLATFVPLFDPDEGRNAEVAREMASGGDLVIPHLAGMPYLDKPPALFWAGSLAIRVIGHTPLAARLPSIVAAMLTLWLVGSHARRTGGARFARISVALLAFAPLFAALSAYVIFDMPLTLCVTVVWLGVAREMIEGGSKRRRLAMFLAIALGLLLKGPVMLAWAIGGSLGAALLMRSRSAVLWLAWVPGWLVALGLAGGWFALATARFPEYPHYAFVEESIERIATGSFHREQPWWFVPAVLVGGALPWSLAAPWSVARVRRAPPGILATAKVGLGFVLFAAFFFTFSHSKLVTYLLPAFAPLAWVAGAAWSDPAPQRRSWAIAAILLIALLIAVPIVLSAGPDPIDAKLAPSGAALARAIASRGPGGVRYERCYSPGTDYLLGRRSSLVSPRGAETTSNYQLRYRDSLIARGQWTALEAPPPGDPAVFVVRPRREASAPPPEGGTEFFRDGRFVAYRITSLSPR
jgi:4-amino-4-deoxy-L-arabinose transferase-like glycosyltransferase